MNEIVRGYLVQFEYRCLGYCRQMLGEGIDGTSQNIYDHTFIPFIAIFPLCFCVNGMPNLNLKIKDVVNI